LKSLLTHIFASNYYYIRTWWRIFVTPRQVGSASPMYFSIVSWPGIQCTVARCPGFDDSLFNR
jgi:hypothetical protein